MIYAEYTSAADTLETGTQSKASKHQGTASGCTLAGECCTAFYAAQKPSQVGF